MKILLLVLVVGLGVATGAGVTLAHPHHDEDELFETVAAVLAQQGKPCDEVLEVSESPTAILVTCRVATADKGAQSVAYRLQK